MVGDAGVGEARTWLIQSGAGIVVLLSVIAIFNYYVDSAGLFHNSGFLAEAAVELESGRLVAGLKDYDERLFQELLIRNLHKRVDVIVLGSSRTMQFRKSFYQNHDAVFFNHSVSGASLEDYMAIIGVYMKLQSYIPQDIILGIDPWVFNRFSEQDRWRKLEPDYQYVYALINGTASSSKASTGDSSIRWKQLTNYDYTVANIEYLENTIRNEAGRFHLVENTDVDDNIKYPDGSVYYPFKQRYPDSEVVKQQAANFLQGKVYSLENFSSMANQDLFRKFVTWLQAKGVRIAFLLPPYHPDVFDALVKNPKYHIIQDVEVWLRNFASEMTIPVYGSYNPHRYGFANKDFFDGMHGLESVLKTIYGS